MLALSGINARRFAGNPSQQLTSANFLGQPGRTVMHTPLAHTACKPACYWLHHVQCGLQGTLHALENDDLVSILQWLPLQQRLGVCSPVSKAFRAAAVAATSSICPDAATAPNNARMDGVAAWLQQHGRALADGLDLLLAPGCSLRQLPLSAHLRQLKVVGAKVQLCPGHSDSNTSVAGSSTHSSVSYASDAVSSSSASPGVLHSCQGLTSLELVDCVLLDSSEELEGLSVLTSLQQLSICFNRHKTRKGEFPVRIVPAVVSRNLAQLSQMVLHEPMQLASLGDLPRFTGLVGLGLSVTEEWDSAELQAALSAMQHLTCLYLHCPAQVSITQQALPCIGQMTGLNYLCINQSSEFDAQLLRMLTGLTALLVDRKAVDPAGQPEAVAALLGVLPQLKSLAHLGLVAASHDEAPDLAQYRALASAAGLTYLYLDGLVPPGFWQYMHQAGSTFPCVEALDLNARHSKLIV